MITENIRQLSQEITARSEHASLLTFDPAQHKFDRWSLIANRIVTLLSVERAHFRQFSGGVEPFSELSALSGVVPHAVDNACEGEPVDIHRAIDLYESLIGQDFTAGVASKKSVNDSVARKQAGAWYTPADLADAGVRLAGEKFIENRLGISAFTQRNDLTLAQKTSIISTLSAASVVDLSCGVGRFLVAWIGFVMELATRWPDSCERKNVATELLNQTHGYDVDPIALGLSRLAIARQFHDLTLPEGAFAAMSARFQVMNPLIPLDHEEQNDWLTDISCGRIYNGKIGRPADFASQRYQIILGNPPWEKIRIEEREFLTHLHAKIQVGTTKSERDIAIAGLENTAPHVHRYLTQMRDTLNTVRRQISNDPLFANSSAGELNTCNLFLELATRLADQPDGVVTLIIKTSTLTHFANRKLFKFIAGQALLNSVFDFQNSNKIFAIDSRERFALVVIARGDNNIRLTVGLTSASELAAPPSTLTLSLDDLKRFNPETEMLFVPQAPENIAILSNIYRQNPVFSDVYPQAKFGRLVHLTMHASEISKNEQPGWIGVQEGKFIERFDGRFSTFENVAADNLYTRRAVSRKLTATEKRDPFCTPQERYYISQETWQRLTRNYGEAWSIFWRSTTSASNKRTCIATVLPHLPAIQSLQMAQLPGGSHQQIALVVATMNSTVFDFVVRNKLSGIDLTQAIVKQAPVPAQEKWAMHIDYQGEEASLQQHVCERVALLLNEDYRLRKFTQPLTPHPAAASSKTHDALMAEVDELMFIAYGVSEGEKNAILQWKNGKRG